MLAHKLELTRNEQFVHNFMMDNQLTKRVSIYNCQKRASVTAKCNGHTLLIPAIGVGAQLDFVLLLNITKAPLLYACDMQKPKFGS